MPKLLNQIILGYLKKNKNPLSLSLYVCACMPVHAHMYMHVCVYMFECSHLHVKVRGLPCMSVHTFHVLSGSVSLLFSTVCVRLHTGDPPVPASHLSQGTLGV